MCPSPREASVGRHLRRWIGRAEFCLSNELRVLWEQHVVWTRLVIISIAASLPDVDGRETAMKFAQLFTSHLVIAAELVTAAKAGNSEAAADAERRWYANADEIAAFLAAINPHWSEKEWRTMLHTHLALTKCEAVYILTQDFSAGIAVFDEIEKQALMMADVMTQGIVRQFPRRFMWPV